MDYTEQQTIALVANCDEGAILSRLVLFALLITASLFVLRIHTMDYPPPTLTDTQLEQTTTRHVSTHTFSPPPFFSASPIAYNSISVDHSPADSVGKIITDTLSSIDLAIQIVSPVQVIPGELISYTLTIRNQGLVPATGIILTNVLSKGLTPIWTLPTQPWCERNDRSTRCVIEDVRSSDAISIALDLSIGGTQTHITNTQLAGVTLDLSIPNCTIDSAQSSITCRLPKLPAGAVASIRIGAKVDTQIAGALINSATITANETAPVASNNHATLTMTVGTAPPMNIAPIPTLTDLVIQADGPSTVIAGQPFTYTYTIINRGELDATGVHFEDALPATANLYAYSPGLPQCEQQGNVLTCLFHDPDSNETIAFTLAITGNTGQPIRITPDQPLPGFPICTVLKERTWLRIVNCELGTLKRGQATHVQLGLVAIGVAEGKMSNAALVRARETDLNPNDNVITSTMTVQVKSDLAIRSAVAGAANAGKPLSYTLTVANNGPSDADSVVLTDTLPMNTRLISATSSQGSDCRIERDDTSPGIVICRLGLVSRDKTATITIVLAVDESLTPDLTLTHVARVSSEQTDLNLSNNELQEAIPVGTGVKN